MLSERERNKVVLDAYKFTYTKASKLAHGYNPNTWDAEAGGQ